MATKQGRVMPNNFEAEQSLLGAIMISQETAEEALAGLSRQDFYYEQHRVILEAMQYLAQCRKPVDFITLSDRLENTDMLDKCGGSPYLAELADIVPSAANWKHYAGIVERDSLLRRLIECSQKIIENAYSAEDAEHTLAYAEKEIFEIGKERETSSLVHAGASANEVMSKFQKILTHSDDATGLMSGFYNLDEITNGFLPAQLIVIAARPGCGKTSFAMNVVANVAQKTPYKKIACFNLEMSTTELTQRLVCNIAEVKMSRALKGNLTQEDLERLWRAKRILDESNIYIDDSAIITPEEILSKCRRLASQKNGLDLIVIDYLQLMTSKDRRDSKQQEVSEISRSMKILAKELKVPVIVMSQMSRSIEQRDDKTPKLSDLRESGAIEQDADMVFFLNPENADTDSGSKPIDLIIAKHRNGPTGEIYFMFDGDSVKFTTAKKSEMIERRRQAAEEKRAERQAAKPSEPAKEPKPDSAQESESDSEKEPEPSDSAQESKPSEIGQNDVGDNYAPPPCDDDIPPCDDDITSVFEEMPGQTLPFENGAEDECAEAAFDEIAGTISTDPKTFEE